MTKDRLDRRVALVTGAARGIGAATALALAQRGIAPVLLVRKPEAASQTARSVEALGVPCRVLPCDVADMAAVQAAVATVVETWGRIDIVVNNAGQVDPIGHFGNTDPAQWASTITVNLVGAYHVANAALPLLLAHGGAVVNVSTGAAHAPREGWSAYCSSKAGLMMFTRCIAHEYGTRGIVSYGLQPGLVDTEMQGRIRDSGMNEISRVPREQLAPPQRSAGVIAWLADAQPADLSGQDLSVNEPSLLERAGL